MNDQLASEAKHFDKKDIGKHREITWSRLAAPYIKETIYPNNDRESFIKELVMPNKPGLVLGCGDMQQEAIYFRLSNSSNVDAIDISKESLISAKKHCKKLGLKTSFSIADINHIKLPKAHYGLVVISHSFHHFEKIEYIAKQIADSLLPDGVFILFDYIGSRYLQYSSRQLKYANKFFKDLPKSLRRDLAGGIRDEINPPLRWGLSINEAIESPRIMPAIESNFCCIEGLLYGGLMHPVLDRVAISFKLENPKHSAILDELWHKDRDLINKLEIEPNFCELILVRKNSSLCRKYGPKQLTYLPSEVDMRYEWLVQTASKEIWRLRQKNSDYQTAIKKRDELIFQITHESVIRPAARKLKRGYMKLKRSLNQKVL